MKFNFFCCKIFAFFSLLIMFPVYASQWVVAGEGFVYTQDIKRTKSEEAVLKALPALILEQLSVKNVRSIPPAELYDRSMQSLITKRLSLFLELSAEIQKRDSLILQNLESLTYQKKLAESKKKINEIQKKIDANLNEQEKLTNQYIEKKTVGNNESIDEDIVLYNSTETSLFEFTPKKDGGSFEYQKEKAVTEAKINGLITGTVVTYGAYMAVTADLVIYPGGVSTGSITEVGLISDPGRIARNIAMRLIPKIQNSLSCTVRIVINPPEYQEKTSLVIDSKVYPVIPQTLELSGGVHNITLDCDGFKREVFTYGFGYEKDYLIEVNLVEESHIDMAVVFKNQLQGDLFYRGVQAEKNMIPVTINQEPVVGYIRTPKDNTIFYMIPVNQQLAENVVFANTRDIDIGNHIEKCRRLMYVSYSALIVSLPFLFYSYGNFTSLSRAYSQRIPVNYDDIIKYQTMSYIAIGVSAGLGAWFVVQLVLYLIAANKALPVQTKTYNLQTYNQSVWPDKLPEPAVQEPAPPEENLPDMTDSSQIQTSVELDITGEIDKANQGDLP